MPVSHSDDDVPVTLVICKICAKEIGSKSSATETVCKHSFHNICITNYVKTNTKCPVCGIKITKDPPPSTSTQRPVSPMTTRSQLKVASAASQQPSASSSGNLQSGNSIDLANLKELLTSVFREQQPVMMTSIMGQLSQTISECVEAEFSRRNLANLPTVSNSSPASNRVPGMQTLPEVEQGQRSLEQLLGLPAVNNSHDLGQGLSNHNGLPTGNSSARAINLNSGVDSILRPDRVSQIIHNWKLKFTGRSGCLSVDNFIYRAEALTNQTLNGNLGLLCANASLLFEDKALHWFWRFHRSLYSFQWSDLCRALRQQYRDSRTDVDFREMIRDRKQQQGETFDSFYESVIDLVDRLEEPLGDTTLVEILRRNLLPDIQHEILNLKISSVGQLRDICRRREFFLQDVKRKHGVSVSKPHQFQKRVNEIEVGEDEVSLDHDKALEVSEIKLSCWNCSKVGHRYQDCLSEKTVFCYGCGNPQTYKPNCPKCASRTKNFQTSAQFSALNHPPQSQ